MAQALGTLQRMLGGLGARVPADIINHALAFAGGLIDAALLKYGGNVIGKHWGANIWLLKNVGLPIANLFIPLPEGLVHECEGQLGEFLGFMLLPAKKKR